MHEDNAPQYRNLEWLKAFVSPQANEHFHLPLRSWEHKWTRVLSEEEIWNFLRSLSFINRLRTDEKMVGMRFVQD
jgi:hypothetical protein